MVAVSCVNLVAIFFALLESKYNFKYGLKLSIIIIFFFIGFRCDYGNDYQAYLEVFQDLNKHDAIGIENLEFKGGEFGWNYLNLIVGKLFGELGFFVLVLILSAFNLVVLYKFIRKNVPSQLLWFAIFFYVFNFEIMLVQCSCYPINI